MQNNKKRCLSWVYFQNPSRAWMPNFGYAVPTLEETTTLDKFVKIQNVSKFCFSIPNYVNL